MIPSFINVDKNSHFPLENLPYGAFLVTKDEVHLCSRIGDFIIDLYILDDEGFFNGPVLSNKNVFKKSKLNHFMSLGREAWKEGRKTLQTLLFSENSVLRNDSELRSSVLIPANDITMAMPVDIGNYTDFYSSEQHARNVGSMFRDPENALLPNWKHLPVAYHGRASSVMLSGRDVRRPRGQILNRQQEPVFSESQRIDFELEVGFLTGTGNALGSPIHIDDAEEHIFGLVLVNDWSARDIQKWEYQPLGPFLAKSWATSISPWIVTMDALRPFRVDAVKQSPQPLEYLKERNRYTFDIELEVALKTQKMNSAETITHSNYKYLYWTMAQQLAHHTINGCNVQPGDLYASGTISGKEKNQFGSMLELTRNGENPIELRSGEQRSFLEDGDTVIMTGYAKNDKFTIGFGELCNTLVPASKQM